MASDSTNKPKKKTSSSVAGNTSTLKRVGTALAHRSVLLFFLILLGYGGYIGYTTFYLEQPHPTSDTPVTLRQALVDEALLLHEKSPERSVPDDLSDPLDIPPGVSEDLVGGGGARPF